MIDFEYTKTFLMLQQEGYLIQSALLSGLNHLRNARLDTKGHFYTASFQLSIGMERLMKATYVVNFMRQNSNATPTNGQLRKFGHGLNNLFDELKSIQCANKVNPLMIVADGSIERQILSALNDFAIGARYHNLDSLVSSVQFSDPLETWNSVIERVLEDDVRPSDIERVNGQSMFLADALSPCSVVIATDLSKKPLSALRLFSLPRLHDIAAGHIVNHVLVIIRALAEQLGDLCFLVLTDPNQDSSAPLPVPHMNEFFDFVHYDRRDVLRKKRWP